MDARPESDEAILSVSDLRKSYGRVTALRGLDLDVPRGSFYGLFGRNGAGKTTTLDCVTGLAVRDRGRVLILGEEIGLEPSPEAKQRLAYIAGHIQLFGWMTLTQHVDLVASAYEAWDPERFAELCGVFPLPMDRRANTLTPGQHLQFQLLMALPRHPELLILDEPGNLDPVVRARLMESMTDILRAEDTTIVMASHLLDELDGVCDHMCIIEDGEALLEGPVTELTRDVREIRLTRATREPDLDGVWPIATAGDEMTVVVRDFSDARAAQIVAQTGDQISNPRTVGLQDFFIALTAGRDQE